MNGIENATTSETDSTLAVRDMARGSKNRTNPGAIKGLFRKAAKAATNSGDEPKPATKRRRRGGETKGEHRKPAHVQASDPGKSPRSSPGQTAARGRYNALWRADEDDRKASEIADEFTGVAVELCKLLLSSGAELLGKMFEDLAAAFSDDCMNPYWPPDADAHYYADEIDNEFSAKQDQNFPHL
jgi:hypothetical protein